LIDYRGSGHLTGKAYFMRSCGVLRGGRGLGRFALRDCVLLPVLTCVACDGSPPVPTQLGAQSTPSWCDEAAERLGHTVCVDAIRAAQTWQEITFPAAAVDQARVTTYLVPVRGTARVPTVFVDANAFEDPTQSLHYKFLTESVSGLELLQYDEYLELIQDAERREWFAGNLTEYVVAGGSSVFGFTVWDDGIDPAAAITCEQFEQVYQTLQQRVDLGTLAVVPANDAQRTTLETCDLPLHDPATALDYEAYSRARRCGTLRRYTLTQLATAEAAGAFGWQDILVTDQAPLDVQTVIAGIVTGSRQGELSHLNVRSAQRGTPNCYVKDAYDLLARWEDQLVQLECGAQSATVMAVTAEEAELCNQGLKPDPVAVSAADLDATELEPLLELPTATKEQRHTALQRYGSKGTNLAVLYQRIDAALQLQGFLIPFHYYDQFMRSNSWSVDLGSGVEELTFHDAIDRFLDDPGFRASSSVRRERLSALQVAMRQAPCDETLVAAIGEQLHDTFGSDETMVRFRSSSNAEDALGFSGAGLYDSVSACWADEIDDDELGPGRCDASQAKERPICGGLKFVWASLWNMKAFDEREWYGIDQRKVAMGILVDTRTDGERANIVAFTGNFLLRGDRRYLVNAQTGELAVVSAVPGVWPERDLLTLAAGEVTQIERARGSTELAEGEWVLSDATLRELGAQLSAIADIYPLDDEVPITARVLLDTEWKLRSDGQLIIKQIRPYLE
jgi:hypothetical protein